jgi:5'-3' exonuclease
VTLALIDGDEALYKAASISDTDVDWDTGATVKAPAPWHKVRNAFEQIVHNWRDAAWCHDLAIVLSPPDRKLFRRGIDPTYKAGRTAKPELYWRLEEWVRKNYRIEEMAGMEADDTMGLLQSEHTVICSQDKDMRTVPGQLYVTHKDELLTIDQQAGDRFWMYQTLIGDSTDGYDGCVGCGKTNAEKLLSQADNLTDWWEIVQARYDAAKTARYSDRPQTRKDALVQAKLARILRPGDLKDGVVTYHIGATKVRFNPTEIAA